MKRNYLPIALLTSGLTLAAQATIIQNDPALDGTYTSGGGASGALPAPSVLTVDWTVGDPGNAVYVGGTLSMDPTGAASFGLGVELALRSDGTPVFTIGKEWGDTVWGYSTGNFGGTDNQNDFSGPLAATTDLDFVVKFIDNGFGSATAAIFLGANATAATEGVADVTTGPFNLNPTTTGITKLIDSAGIVITGSNGEAVFSNFRSGDEWAVIPEPSTLGLMGLALAGLLRRINRR